MSEVAKPIKVISELKIIVDRRHGECEGCEWHPDVCQHCLNSFNADNWEMSLMNYQKEEGCE